MWGAAPGRCDREVMEKQERWRGREAREGGSGGMSEEDKVWSSALQGGLRGLRAAGGEEEEEE